MLNHRYKAHQTLEETVAIDEHREFLERAQAVAHIGSWVAELNDPERSDRVSWSAETYRIFDVPVGGFDGTTEAFLSFVHPNDLAVVQSTAEGAIRNGTPYDIEHRIVTRSGQVRWVHERADIERREDGRAVRMIGTVQDITDRRELLEELHHAQKMEAVGRLAGGVAHDLNNALTAVIGYTELVLPQLEDREQTRQDVEEIRHAAVRAASVAQQLLAFSRKQLIEPRAFNLNGVVENMVRLLEHTLGPDIHVRLVLEPGLPTILGDPGQVEQAIVNLSVNARDAMLQGGELTIRTQHQHVDESFARSHPPMPVGRYVVISVADTGHGFDAETKARIFEPFFTTKEAGKGTGLGLAMVYGTVKQCGGFIFVESEPGKGSTFQLYFPDRSGLGPNRSGTA